MDILMRLGQSQRLCLVAPATQGLSFLGFRVFPGVIRIAHSGWRRFRRKVMAPATELAMDAIDAKTWRRSMASLVGHLRQAQTRNLRAPFLSAGYGLRRHPARQRNMGVTFACACIPR
jgi:hypothetical protein